MYHRWTRKGWKQLEPQEVMLIENFTKANHVDNNWYTYKSRSGCEITYTFSHPGKEIKKQYNLLDGDICSIRTVKSYCDIPKVHSRFTIIRNIKDETMRVEIRGGRKPKFFKI